MLIRRITKMKPHGVFRDFTWPSELPEFARYNLVYGWNCTGKTTISNLLRCLETRTIPGESQVAVRIDDRDLSGSEFVDAQVPIRVFNKQFMAENVFTSDRGVAPIYVLGKANIEKQKALDTLKGQLPEKQQDREKHRRDKEDCAKGLEDFCTSQARVIRHMLGREGNSYFNYDKRNFREKASQLAADEGSNYVLDTKERESLLKQHAAAAKPRIRRVEYVLPNLEELRTNVSQVLSTKVVSTVIKSLTDDYDLAKWTHEGLNKHKERKAASCLFCGQPLPGGLIDRLEGHFSEEYEGLLKTINVRLEDIGLLVQAAENVASPNKAELYDELAKEYDQHLKRFSDELGVVKNALLALTKALEAKKGNPFRTLDLDIQLPTVDVGSRDRLNELIDRHNSDCDAFDQRVQDARQRLESDSVAGNLDGYSGLAKASDDAQARFDTTVKAVAEIQAGIEKLETEIVTHSKPAVELNQELCAYLGHGELQLEIREAGYQITRSGQVANGLSEGETTAIALLYFLKSLTDHRFDIRRGVVVLDDPVSSLDSNALFCATGHIRARTQDAGQLFVLTHNFTFFREVRNWFGWLNDHKKLPARFYMLDCTLNARERCSSIRRLDPLLKNYESEYHYLFSRVLQVVRSTDEGTLRDYYLLPNVARRVLEAFLAFRRPELTRGGLWAKLESVDFDQEKKLKIYRFINAHSHHGQIGEPEHDLSVLGETRAVLGDLLLLMKKEDPDHTAAMYLLCPPRPER